MAVVRDRELPAVYDPGRVEGRWYSYWEENGFFHQPVQPGSPAFSIVMPPPNVTGSLHLGHALDNTLQDILARWRRLQGYNTLWLPGTDHAGIATQARVEEDLAREGLKKEDLGREGFLERVWAWKREYGGRITRQLRLLGASCDWQRERFTMDEGCSRAVREVFVQLYRQGLIYRGDYLVNWCPGCRTTISDIEVEHSEDPGHLWHIRYPLVDGGGYLTVATTRPETMLGDTAVAVNPADDRYAALVGRRVVLPLVGREIPVVADEYVDPEFGTGVVKITPAHDPNDFELARRHDLPPLVVLGLDGRMTAAAGPYQGLSREECRRRVVADLAEGGYLAASEDYSHSVGHCYRCATVIEPMISTQWFVRMPPLAEPARQAVLDGRIRFVPERFTKVYLDWLDNIRDWCISRQLWWGHRIPVWYCAECGAEICRTSEPAACPQCGCQQLKQDPDVLDTWFSSALWPFSTLGWPQVTPELEQFYPTAVLVTGRDIIFFWVARMIFMSLKFRPDVPFREVFIHGLVLDAQGRKMSKSLGNGVDPVEVIERYGADSLRFMLVTGNTPGNDLRFHEERLEGARNFCNKIWNAARFVLLNLEQRGGAAGEAGEGPAHPPEVGGGGEPPVDLADRWITSRLNTVIAEVTLALENYELGEAARILQEFTWNEFCDWYIELAKPRLYGSDAAAAAAARQCLGQVLARSMELLHPFLPFLTEEVWQRLPGRFRQAVPSLMLAAWPQTDPARRDEAAEASMDLVQRVVRAVRAIRAEFRVPPAARIEVIAVVAAAGGREALLRARSYLEVLAGALSVSVLERLAAGPPRGAAAAAVGAGVEVYVPLAGLIDLAREEARLRKETREVGQELERVRAKLANAGFLAKAPPAVVAKEETREAELAGRLATLEKSLACLSQAAIS